MLKQQSPRHWFAVGLWLLLGLLLILFSWPDFNQLKIGLLVVLVSALVWGLYMLKLLQPARDVAKLVPQPWPLILERLAEAVIVYDRQFKVIYANQAFGQLVDLSPEVLVNQQVASSLVSNPRYRKLVSIFFPALAADEFLVVEDKPAEIIRITINKPTATETGEPIYLQVTTLPVTLADVELFIKIVLDTTSQVKRERETTDLLNLMAHHIRTPLNQLRWLLDTLRAEQLSASDLEVLANVRQVITNTLTFTDLMLADLQFTLGETRLHLESQSITDVIGSIISLLSDLIKDKQLQVSIEVNEEVRVFPFDKQLIFLALYAVIENAVIYNQSGGQIIIQVKRVPQREEVEIKVSDTGIGIKPEEQDRLFEKYFRGSAAKRLKNEGLGIGLYFTRKLLGYHKGEITAANRAGGGSVFTITLPIDPELLSHYNKSE